MAFAFGHPSTRLISLDTCCHSNPRALSSASPLQALGVCKRRLITRPNAVLGRGQELNEGIANFYDESSGLWEDMWGEHMHHGYYEKGETVSNQQAQINMISNALDWAGITQVTNMVDVGCGIGGSSRYIAKRFGSSGKGITLSPVQAARANALTAEAGLADRVSFQVADALQQPFAAGEFDLAWSLESGEHMPDKERFVGELVRVTAPGGRVLIITWCHRVLQPNEDALEPHEQALLDRICEAYYLPKWCSIADYERIMKDNGMQDIKTADWSEMVSPFWGAVIKSALSTAGVSGLFKAGWTTIKGALVMPLMARGLAKGTIKFNCITATKPN